MTNAFLKLINAEQSLANAEADIIQHDRHIAIHKARALKAYETLRRFPNAGDNHPATKAAAKANYQIARHEAKIEQLKIEIADLAVEIASIKAAK